jgi:hypothetical protein
MYMNHSTELQMLRRSWQFAHPVRADEAGSFAAIISRAVIVYPR